MSEELQNTHIEEGEERGDKPPLPHPIALGGATFLTVGAVDLLAHLGPTGLVVGGIAAIFAARHGNDIHELVREMISPSCAGGQSAQQLIKQKPQHSGGRSILDRALGRFPELEEPEYRDEDSDGQEEYVSPSFFTFSQVLTNFAPSLNTIYLATLPDGTLVYSDAKGLCHVALAGTTGEGKSNLIRLLMSQLCKAGASVLLLNPHYTRYDLEAKEDWTPFEPYLVYDPMECRKYDVIEHYLKQVATILLPKRMEKYAHSQPLGKPYYIVLDELPATVAHIKEAPEYLSAILREGRKVGIFLITAAQDFLVKTIAPQGGGAIRECYRTAFYVGGDPTTARVLLDLPANQIQEDVLGKGAVMMRNLSIKQATLAHVPYVDNQSLYRLLGPSTYVASAVDREDDMFLENLQPGGKPLPEQLAYTTQPTQQQQVPPTMPPLAPNPYRHDVPQPTPLERPSTAPQQPAAPTGRFTQSLSPELQRAFDAYQPGMGNRALGRILGIHHATAARHIQLLTSKGMIDANGQKNTG